ncbi:luciferase family oxidoreductase group 1 [Thermocatellispora tengchongensis]|uniref:Luciferase family oxidoreductase group 1 n=1 Tax=Thermocatellispora tengchongensis TaxID=1073253 RepID=A0A840NVP4_9ACTN|nr:LLM class flavin-dependent oxidoreductase [Thermocatellispora tengchongensis]MBB5132864.1 luciferase family oxidoreductase group 1 [Thermocatellispora tengchongensis]
MSDVAETPAPDDQIRGIARGDAEVPLSILDLATVSAGHTPSDALRTSTELARRAEEWGYHRLWVAEHHGMPSVASSSPAVLIAHLAANTSTIRLGSGGVMLPNHAPLVIAEQFGTLHALHPGRIDLGLGRAPGTDQATANALRRGDAERFPQEVADLTSFLDGSFPAGHPYARIKAVPADPSLGRPPIWLLGSSGFSAQLAGLLGLPFAFAHHFSAANTGPALDLYRSSFQPSAVLDRPYALIGVSAVAADTAEQARRLARTGGLSMLRLRRGQPAPIPTPEEAESYPYSEVEEDFLEAWLSNVVIGDAQEVRTGLSALRERFGVDELMITTTVYGGENRLRSYELIARAYKMIDDM